MASEWEDIGSVNDDGWEDISPETDESILGGVGTALLDIVGGIPGAIAAPIAGAVKGISSGSAKEGLDTAKKVMDTFSPSTALEAAGVDMPKNNKGYEYAMKPFELLSKGMELGARGTAELASTIIPGMSQEDIDELAAANELGILGLGGAATLKGLAKVKGKKGVDESLDKIKGKGEWEDIGSTQPVDLETIMRETDNLPENQRAPFSEIVPDAVSEVNPARDRMMARRQMELDLDGEGVLNVDSQGQVFKGTADDAAYTRAKSMEEEALARTVEPIREPVRQQGEVFAPINPYDVGGHVSRLREGDVTVLDSPQRELFGATEAPERLTPELAARITDELEAAKAAQFRDMAQQGSLDFGPMREQYPLRPEIEPAARIDGQTDMFAPKQAAERIGSQAVARVVEAHPLVKKADEAVAKAEEAVAKLEQANASIKDLENAQKALAKAQEHADTVRTNLAKNVNPTGKKRGRPSTKKQSGGIDPELLTLGLSTLLKKWQNRKPETTVGENQRAPLKNIPGVAEKLKDFVPENRPMEEIIAEAKTRPDVDQNFAQRLINNLTAGGLYQSLKTNNIVVKKTFETISNAYDRAQQLNRSLLQGDLLPKMRNLNLKEKGEIWAKMMLAEGKERLTPEQLRADGFSEKQVAMYESYRKAADYALKSINEARAAAGKPPIDARTGYVAGVFSGDFRRVLYKTVDGKKTVVGVVGDNTRLGLNRSLQKIKEAHPDWEIGEEKYYGGTGRSAGERQKAFEQAIEMLAENDPNVRSLVQTYQELMTQDAYNYLNQRRHTKQKKGVEGSEGRKEWESIEKNALEGMKAQVRYLENSYRWAELSKAAKELQPLLSDPDIKMPNAKDWANKYIDRALGISDSHFSKAMDNIMDGIAKEVGVGPTVFGNLASGAKNVVSKTLLGFVNLPFLAINLVQPIVGLPNMAGLLASRGVNPFLGVTKAAEMGMKRVMGKELKGFDKEAMDFAEAHGITSSEIFDHASNVHKSVGHYVNKVAEFGIPQIEEGTRATTFFTLAHTLKEAGMKVDEGLFETAQKMTNMVMTDYRPIEAPSAYTQFGPVGHLAANLVRFKHNQLSAMSFFAREIKNNKALMPLGIALATNVASAGILGMIGFKEADTLYQMLTSAMGKPDTLTNVVLQNFDTMAAHGMFSAATGIDFSNRLGLQDVVPNSIAEAAFPGGNRLVDAVAAVPAMFGSDADRMRAVREFLPNSLRGATEKMFFEDEAGRSINPKNLQPVVQRDATDRAAKWVGLTGVKESDTKAKLYQQRLIDKQYASIRQSATKKILDDLYVGKGVNQEAVQKYLDAEGDPTTLANAIEKFKVNSKMTEFQRRMLATSAGTSVNASHRMKRLQEAGIE